MTVATRLQPNFTTMTATQYKAAIDGDFSVVGQTAGAYAPHESFPLAMTVTVDAGRLPVGGVLSNAQQTTGTIVAPVSLPRIDRVVIDAATGVVSVITGTPAGSPTPPAITAGKLPVAQVLLQTTSTVITNSMITDERTFVPVPRREAIANVFNTAGFNLVTGTPTILTADSEVIDTEALHDLVSNTSRLTVPAGYLFAQFQAIVRFTNNATGDRDVELLKNGAPLTIALNANVVVNSGTVFTRVSFISPWLNVVAGDFFEIRATQNSGGNLNANLLCFSVLLKG